MGARRKSLWRKPLTSANRLKTWFGAQSAALSSSERTPNLEEVFSNPHVQHLGTNPTIAGPHCYPLGSPTATSLFAIEPIKGIPATSFRIPSRVSGWYDMTLTGAQNLLQRNFWARQIHCRRYLRVTSSYVHKCHSFLSFLFYQDVLRNLKTIKVVLAQWSTSLNMLLWKTQRRILVRGSWWYRTKEVQRLCKLRDRR